MVVRILAELTCVRGWLSAVLGGLGWDGSNVAVLLLVPHGPAGSLGLLSW